MNVLARVEMPERSASAGIDRFERLRVIAEEHQSAFSGHRSGEGAPTANLHRAPGWFVSLESVSKQNAFPVNGRNVFHACRIVGMPLLKFFCFLEIQIAVFGRKKIKQPGIGIIGGRVPVGRAAEARTDARAFGAGYSTREDGAAL